MTYLSYPRIAFHSDDAISNVSTANNQNVVDILDFDNVTLKNPHNLEPEAYRDWLMELCDDVQQPGHAPRRTMFGYWNYYGDQLTTFGNAGVTSVLLPGEPAPGDLLATSRVALTGRLVDLDPADTFSSQMFVSSFVVTGTKPDGEQVTLIQGTDPTVAATRFLNFNRPMGAGNFYCVVPSERLAFAPRGTSPALDVLRDAVDAGAGLSIGYCFYDFVAPIMTDEQVEEMREAFLRGDYVLNAKVGRVAGTFGAWDGTTPVSAPGGRWLAPVQSPYVPTPGAHDAPVPLSHGAVDAMWQQRAEATDAAPASPPMFGPAFVVVSDSTVTIDMSATVPERSPTDMTKVDVGRIALYAGDAFVGEIDYSREAYERLGGVAVVPVPATARAAIGKEPLSLRCQADIWGHVVAEQVEFPYAVIADQCVYLNLPDAKGEVEVRVFEPDGSPLARAATFAVEQWQDYNYPQPPVTPEVVTTPPTVYSPQFGFRRVPSGDPRMMVPDTLDVPAGGVARLSLDAHATGCYKIRLLAPGAPSTDPNGDQGSALSYDYYFAVRVLPEDDYSHVPDEQVTWDFVWREVFLYYALMYPVMSQYVPWGPANAPLDPDRVHTLAVVLRELVDARNFGSAMYMPVTRELSNGKRELVRRWCELQLGGDGVDPAASAARRAGRGFQRS